MFCKGAPDCDVHHEASGSDGRAFSWQLRSACPIIDCRTHAAGSVLSAVGPRATDFADRIQQTGASMNKPIWEPSAERMERANMQRFVRFVRDSTGNEDIRRYGPLYDFSIRQPERFWPLVWEFCGIRASGDHEPVLVDRDKMPGARWFPGVRLNFAQNLLALQGRPLCDRVPQRMGPPARIELRRTAYGGRQAGARIEAGWRRCRRPRCRLSTQPAGDRNRDAGGDLARRDLVVVLAGFRHPRRSRSLRPDRAEGAVHRRRATATAASASIAWTRSAACSTNCRASNVWW